MNEPKFLLKEPKPKEDKGSKADAMLPKLKRAKQGKIESKEPTLIYLFFRFNNQQLKYSTGQKVKIKYWNTERQRAREVIEFPEAEKINELLDNLSTITKDTYRSLINQKKPPTPDKIKIELNKFLYKDESTQQLGLLSFIEKLINTTNKKKGTVKKYRTTLNVLLEYKRKTKREINFETINIDFYYSFLKFLTGKGYAQNTVGGHIKNIKVFMNEAIERKLTSNFEHKGRKFKVVTEQVDKIYLSQNEVSAIYKLDLSQIQRLDRVRDLFIIACCTGLRFSDLKNLNTENITKDGNFLRIKTDKTNEIVVIPMHKYVREIFAKYDNSIPVAISNQKMNDYLKEIAEMAKLNNSVKIGITKGGLLQHEVFKKSDLVSTHTARRSFATNAYLMNVPSISIMKITGHHTEKSFMRYIRISQEENAEKLSKHPFFS